MTHVGDGVVQGSFKGVAIAWYMKHSSEKETTNPKSFLPNLPLGVHFPWSMHLSSSGRGRWPFRFHVPRIRSKATLYKPVVDACIPAIAIELPLEQGSIHRGRNSLGEEASMAGSGLGVVHSKGIEREWTLVNVQDEMGG